MTYRASRAGARVGEVPITFRDRRVGQCKMSRRIIVEALFVVIRLAGTSCAAASAAGRQASDRGLSGPGRPPGQSAACAPSAGSASCSTPGRSRTPTAPRSPRSTSAAARRPSTPTRSRASRSRSSSSPTSTTRPTASRACRRRSAAAAADAAAAVGGADRRPVPAARRVARCGLARRAGRRRRRRLPRGRRRPLPIASGLPVVATLLDLAPWALPDAYQRTPAARFGQRLRARILRDAAAVIVGSGPSARAARRLLHVKRDRIRVVPLAPRAAFAPEASGCGSAERRAARPARRYPVYTGPLRRPPGPRHAAAGAGRLAAAPARRRCPRRRRGRRGSAGRRDPGRPRRARPGGRARGRRGPARLCAAPARRPARRARARRAGGAPAGRCRRRPASPRSRRSPAGRRSSRQRSAPCPRSSARPASSWSRATRRGSPPRCGRSGPTSGARADRGAAARERAAERRTWADVARETRRGLGRGRRPDAG